MDAEHIADLIKVGLCRLLLASLSGRHFELMVEEVLQFRPHGKGPQNSSRLPTGLDSRPGNQAIRLGVSVIERSVEVTASFAEGQAGSMRLGVLLGALLAWLRFVIGIALKVQSVQPTPCSRLPKPLFDLSRSSRLLGNLC